MSVNLGTAYAELKLNSTGFNQGLREAQGQLETFKNQAGLVASGLQGVGGALTKAGSTLTKSVTVPLLGIGTAAVKTTATFDQSMSKVQALSGATAEEFDTLREKAIEMGSETAFTASEAADAFSYMALAGWDTEQMLSGIEGVLNLAASSQMDLAEASDMVTDYLTAFGLEAEHAGVMADQMSYAQANSNTTTQQLGDAFGNCAAQMHTAGQTMETTTALLEAMANQGTKGSEAGTALSAVMRDITQKMEDGAIAIGDTSVAVMDEQGNFRSLIDIMADVEKATDGMGTAEKSAALMSTFTARSIKAVGEILTEGTDKIYGYEEALHGVDGAAKDMAETMLNNLNGQLTLLKSKIETLMIQIGDLLLPYIKEIVEKISNLVEKFSSLSEEQKMQIIRWAGIAAAIGPVLLIVGKLLTSFGGIIATGVKVVSWVSKLASAFGILGGGVSSISGLLAGLASAAAPILAVVAAVTALVLGLKALYDQGGKFAEAVDRIRESLGEGLKQVIEDIRAGFDKLKEGFQTIIEMVKNSFDFGAVDEAMANLVGAFENLMAALQPVFDILKQIGTVIAEVAGGMLLTTLSAIIGVINGIVQALAPLIDTITDIVNIVTDVVNVVTGLIEGIITGDFTKLKDAVSSLGQDIWQFLQDLVTTIVTFFEGFFEGFKTTFDTFTGGLFTQAQEFLSNLWNSIVQFFTVTIPQAFTNFVTVTVPNFINSIKEWFDKLPYNIGYAVGQAIVKVTEWGVQMKEKAIETGKNFVENVINFIKSLPMKIATFTVQVISKIIQWGIEMKNKATETGRGFVDGVVNFIKTLPQKVHDFIKDIPQKILAVKDSMIAAGQAIFNGLWEGMKSVWDSIVGWFEGVAQKVRDFIQGIKDGMSEAKSASQGSHADGLAYVPYNGYRATLHEGERVLTRNEASAYSSGGLGNTTIIFQSPKALDPYESNKLFRETIRRMEEGFA